MRQLGLASSLINKIVDDPTILGNRLNGADNSTGYQSLGLTSQQADHILDGYNNGFRVVFIMNAVLAAIATIVSILMIRHKELTRGDEVELKAQAEKEELKKSRPVSPDIELGKIETNDETIHDKNIDGNDK